MHDVFARQIRMAVEYDLPIVVHARDADDDTFQVLQQWPGGIVMMMLARHMPRQHKVYIHAFQGSRARFE